MTVRARSIICGVGYSGSLRPCALSLSAKFFCERSEALLAPTASTANVLVPASLINVISTFLTSHSRQFLQ